MSTTSASYLASAAIRRASELLKILDREHDTPSLYRQLTGVRYEVETALRFMPNGAAPKNRASTPSRAERTRPESHRHNILRMLDGELQWTSLGIARFLAIKPSVVRTRMRELSSAQWVRAYSSTVDLVTKRQSTLWQITKRGKVALGVLEAGQLVLMEVKT